MIIGIYVSSGSKYVGGGYVYQKCLLENILIRQANLNFKDKIIFFYKGENELISSQARFSVNSELYHGKLNEALMRHHVDILWFLSVSYEDVDIPHIMPVWDLQHRIQTYFPEVSSGGEYIARDNIYSHFLPRATYVLTGTEKGKKEISFFYNVPADRIFVNPLPSPQYISNERIAITEELLNANLVDNTYLFYPAQFWPHKNHVVLLEALKILKSQKDMKMKLVFTGSDQGNADHIIQKISEMGLVNDVILLGFVSTETILWLYQNAFALVYPSFFGPDNIPPIEAFSAGCPVIASNIDGAKEQLGDAAILIEPYDEVGFAEAIRRLAEDPLLREDLIRKGYETAKKRTADNYVQMVFDIIEGFYAIRRCWGTHYRIQYTPAIVTWVNGYLQNREIHSLLTLLSICTDKSLEETYNNILSTFDCIVDANRSAEIALAGNDYETAFEILHNILAECVDYAPVHINLAKIYYFRSETDIAFTHLKKANFYNSRLKTLL